MRAAAASLCLVALALAGCSAKDEPQSSSDPPGQLVPPGAQGPGGPGGGGATPGAPAAASAPAPAGPTEDAKLSEVVYVLVQTPDQGDGFCTGTLVAKDVVLTAGHCLEPDWSFEVVAPGAAGAPRVAAASAARYSDETDDPAQPDIGIIRLEQPIELPAYAQMTDISARVDGGEKLSGAALVRVDEEPEADLKIAGPFAISSDEQYGYDHGITTPMFSEGGDSGAGLFLLENGKRTHKIIGVERQPEPSRNVDHFTRTDAAFMTWYQANVNGDG